MLAAMTKFHAQMVGLTRSQKPRKLAESAEISQFLAESANSANGLYRLLKRSQRLTTGERSATGSFERKNPLESIPKIAILALSANLWFRHNGCCD